VVADGQQFRLQVARNELQFDKHLACESSCMQ
jgi:hypothetical protein